MDRITKIMQLLSAAIALYIQGTRLRKTVQEHVAAERERQAAVDVESAEDAFERAAARAAGRQ